MKLLIPRRNRYISFPRPSLLEFTVASIKKSPINEIFPNEEGDKWYKFKVAFVTIDEVSAKEHRANSNILVIGNDLMNAADHLIENMKDSMSDYEIVSIAETSILDIFPYTMDDNSDTDLTHLPKEDGSDADIME